MSENKKRSVNTFYPIRNASKEEMEKTCINTIGNPVWDNPKTKTRQIGIVTDATIVDDEKLGIGICLTIELLDETVITKINKTLPRGVSIGGKIK